jgi:hypothetical protein
MLIGIDIERRPTFAPLADGLEFYVRIVWASGVQARVDHFGTLQDAQRWIDRESENWLQIRGYARRCRQSDEDGKSIVSHKAYIQILQAA